MTTTPEAMLNRRVKSVSRKQPEILILRHMLLEIGGLEIVVNPVASGLDYTIPLIAKFGKLIKAPVILKPMDPSRCHSNAATLWRQRKKGSRLFALGTGFALSNDNLWRRHSWALTKSSIIETTETRVKYFGMLMYGKAADFFATHIFTRRNERF